jgi:hypothetical protein
VIEQVHAKLKETEITAVGAMDVVLPGEGGRGQETLLGDGEDACAAGRTTALTVVMEETADARHIQLAQPN